MDIKEGHSISLMRYEMSSILSPYYCIYKIYTVALAAIS